ncbi:MAG: alpha/beta fold hydrolase [Myxococcales bacterium]|nr:alpha/beta fold hydrolase [Myxococcales bacterium]
MLAEMTRLALRPALEWQDRQRRFLDATVLRDRPAPRWTTANRVIAENAVCRLRDFSQAGASAPLLIVPPEVNHSAIADFGPGQSLVAAALQNGFGRVAALEWKSATRESAGRDIDDSLLEIRQAIETLGGPVHLVGLCQGGWESAMLCALEPALCRSLTLVAAPIDFHAGLGLIRAVSAVMPMAAYQALVTLGGGVMRGDFISLGFDNLLPLERYALKSLAVYNHLDDQEWMARFLEMEDWYRTPKDLPGRLYLRVVQELFKENRLIEGRFFALGRRVELARVACPLALVAGSRDHITPPPQLWAMEHAARSRHVLREEIPAGHVGTFMGRVAIEKHWPRIFRWLQEKTSCA